MNEKEYKMPSIKFFGKDMLFYKFLSKFLRVDHNSVIRNIIHNIMREINKYSCAANSNMLRFYWCQLIPKSLSLTNIVHDSNLSIHDWCNFSMVMETATVVKQIRLLVGNVPCERSLMERSKNEYFNQKELQEIEKIVDNVAISLLVKSYAECPGPCSLCTSIRYAKSFQSFLFLYCKKITLKDHNKEEIFSIEVPVNRKRNNNIQAYLSENDKRITVQDQKENNGFFISFPTKPYYIKENSFFYYVKQDSIESLVNSSEGFIKFREKVRRFLNSGFTNMYWEHIQTRKTYARKKDSESKKDCICPHIIFQEKKCIMTKDEIIICLLRANKGFRNRHY